MRRVLHVGPCNTPGGMAKVIEILSENPPEGWAAETLNSHSNKGIFAKLAAWTKARRFLKKNIDDYDVVHIHSAANWSYRRKLNLGNIGIKRGKQVVFHIHSGIFDSYAIKNKAIKTQLNRFKIVVLSNYWKEKLEPIIGGVSVIENPIDPKLQTKVIGEKKPKQILLLGRADPVKGHHFAFDVARVMVRSGWNLKVTGIDYNEPGIEGLGWVTEEEKYSLLRDSEVLIIPSQFEGQPLVMMEGLAAKCKVVASDKVPGLPDCVIAAQFNNREDWVEKITQSQPINAAQYIKDHEIEQISSKWAELYNNLVLE